VRILLVDDHPLIRKGLAERIAEEPDMEVCGEAESLPEAISQVKSTHPNVVVVDLSLKSGHGIDLIEQIKAHNKNIKMLVLSLHDESLFGERALRAGALGYLSKQEPPARVIKAIRQILSGEICVSEKLTSRLLHSVVGDKPLEEDPIQTLSNRELEVFELIGEGMTTKQIAAKLHLSPKTIESHREKIGAKLGTTNSNELICRAARHVLESR
jgi:DNA-binding NarL/FixJ family response regulator